jgi:tetratricopeptide (TPR) repeat protein
VYYDETASLYLPTDEPHREMRERAEREFAALRDRRPTPPVANGFWSQVSVPVAALRRDSAYGDFLLTIGKPADAVDVYKRALAIDPSIGELQFNLGIAYWSSGRSSEALVEWRDILRRNPHDERARNAIDEGERRLNTR